MTELPAGVYAEWVAYLAEDDPHNRLEAQLGQFIMRDATTSIIEPGLGANDVPGNTHILRVVADEVWWADLPDRLARQFWQRLQG